MSKRFSDLANQKYYVLIRQSKLTSEDEHDSIQLVLGEFAGRGTLNSGMCNNACHKKYLEFFHSRLDRRVDAAMSSARLTPLKNSEALAVVMQYFNAHFDPESGECAREINEVWSISNNGRPDPTSIKRVQGELREIRHEFECRINIEVETYMATEITSKFDPTTSNQVFISCGQRTEAERTLGKEIVKIIGHSGRFTPYFADMQSDLGGLKENIFRAISNSVGYVCVMHHRGDMDVDGKMLTRASVWIEQEVALAAYVHSMRSSQFSVVRAYIQCGIHMEGLRSLIQLNPMQFNEDCEVLDDLRLKFPQQG